MTTVFLGLGSNRGDRKKNILNAIKLLKKNGQKVLRVSLLHETKPYGYKKQKKFLNAAVKLKTKLLPLELFELCKKIEKEIGRDLRERLSWGKCVFCSKLCNSFFGGGFMCNSCVIIFHQKGKGVSPLLAPKTLKNLPLGRDHERRCLFFMKWTQSFKVAAGFF